MIRAAVIAAAKAVVNRAMNIKKLQFLSFRVAADNRTALAIPILPWHTTKQGFMKWS
jgi:hypothetical protein